jgi:signal transduction histidine kinase
LLAHDVQNIYETELGDQKQIYFRKMISITNPDLFTGLVRVDSFGTILACQKTGLGIWKNNKLIFRLPIDQNDFIEELAFDKNNLLWMVTRRTGIDVFSLHPENLSQYLQPVYHFSNVQITGSPRSFAIDKTGIIWIGTRDDGLISFKQEGNHLYLLNRFDAAHGLTDNFVTAIACDSQDNIIAGTQTGVDRLVNTTNKTYRIENLSKSSNFFSLINQVWAEGDKQAYALTSSGVLLQISPTVSQKNFTSPVLLLEEMRVNAQPIATEKNNFRWKENNISFLIAAPSFIDEKQVVYSYLMEGSGNEQWSDTASTNAVINLTNLSAGKYVLKVKAFFHSTSYSPTELSYSFEITPPWWQTWWFKIVAGLLIVVLSLIGFRLYYNRRLEKQMAALEKKQAIEKERTRIATDMHDDLGAGLSKIKFLSETIGIKKQKQESFEEDISKIREYSHEMIDKMGEIVWALNERNDSLSDLISYSRSYAVEYLSQSGIECNVEIPDNFPTVFVSGEFRRNIYLTLKEALHNVVKHAQAGHLKITISVNHYLAITIQDDGIGFDKNKIRPFSNGLTNMEKRMKDIGGSIQIKKNEKGTSVELIAPLTR